MTTILPYRDIQPKIDPNAIVLAGAIVVGDVHIGAGSTVWYNSVIRGDVNIVRIGCDTNIQDGTVIHVAKHGQGSFIGDRVTIGHMALIHACTIADDAFVGMKAAVLDGARIEPFGMLAAGALLTPNKVLPSHELWAGSPARKMRDLTEADYEVMRRTVPRYAKLGIEHKLSLVPVKGT